MSPPLEVTSLCIAGRHQYNTSVNMQVVLIMVLTFKRILTDNNSCLFIWYEHNCRRTAMSIQAFQEVLDSYKFWRTERHHQTRNQRKNVSSLPICRKGWRLFYNSVVRSADLGLNLRFVVSKQDSRIISLNISKLWFWQLNTNIKDLRMPDRDLENNLLTSDKWEVFKNITNLSAGVNGVYGLLMTLQSTRVRVQ